MPDLAIDHAQAGRDAERVNRLFLMNAERAFGSGHSETARRWLGWFEEENLVEQLAVAVLGIFTSARATRPQPNAGAMPLIA